MKKIIISIMLLANLTYADFIRGSIGGNIPAKETETLNYSAFIDFKHPWPMVPNIRISKSVSEISEDIDGILYYNILDETFLLSLDVGAGVQNKKIESNNYDKILLSAYAKTKIDLPLSDLSFKLRGMASVVDKDNSYKLEALLEYKLIDSVAFDLIFDIGYKYEHLSTIIDEILDDMLDKNDDKDEAVFLELNFTI